MGGFLGGRNRNGRRMAAAALALGLGLILGGGEAYASSVRVGSVQVGRPGSGGVQTQIVDSSESIGPKVQETSLRETFHSDYQTYELSLDDRFFFYSSVGNGGITDQPVRLEIPPGISFSAEKDGRDYALDPALPITERGSYILTFSLTEDVNKPFSEQTILKANFRFRIQDKPALQAMGNAAGSQAASAGSNTGSWSGDTSGGWSGTTSTDGWTTSQEMSVDQAMEILNRAGYNVEENTAASEEGQTEPLGLDDELPPPGEEETESAGETEDDEDLGWGDVTGEEGEKITATLDENGEWIFFDENGQQVDEETWQSYVDATLWPDGSSLSGSYDLDGFNLYTGIACVYDPMNGYYQNKLATGDSFYTDIPNGMSCRSSVTILTNDEISFRVLRDGEEIEYTVGEPVTEPGSYVVYPSQSSSLFASEYFEKGDPVFAFRILPEKTRDLSLYNVPEKSEIKGVTRDGQPVDSKWVHNEWVYLDQDGEYTIDMKTEAGSSSVTFTRDTAAPKFTVEVENNIASVTYADNDADSCVLLKDGKEVSSGNLIAEVSAPGKYTLEVYDQVGNSSSAEFEIIYHMNTAAVVAILLAIILVLAGIVFLRRTGRKFEVR